MVTTDRESVTFCIAKNLMLIYSTEKEELFHILDRQYELRTYTAKNTSPR